MKHFFLLFIALTLVFSGCSFSEEEKIPKPIKKSIEKVKKEEPKIPEKAGWKRYENTKFGYELQYPDTFTLQSPSETKEEASEVSFQAPKEKGWSQLSVRVLEKGDERLQGCGDLLRCAQKNRNIFSAEGNGDLKEYTFLGNKAFTERIESQKDNRVYRILYTYKGGKLYILSKETEISNKETGKPILDEVMTTFQF